MGARIITITSGKGGTGKSFVASHLAHALASKGHATLLIDADLGLPNLDILMGIEPVGSLARAMQEGTGWQENSVAYNDQLHVMCGGLPGGYRQGDAATVVSHLQRIISLAPHTHVVVDAPSGLSPLSLELAEMAHTALLVLSPDPAGLADGYRMVGAACQEEREVEWAACLNMTPAKVSGALMHRFRTAVAGQFSCPVADWGSIPADPGVLKAVRQRQMLSQVAPKSAAAKAIEQLATKAVAEPQAHVIEMSAYRAAA